MLKYVALASLMLLPQPALAEGVPVCHMKATSTAEAFYLDIQQETICRVYAYGYLQGVVNTADELWFSIPEHLKWQEIIILYQAWYITHQEQAKDIPAWAAITHTLAEKFPMPKKEPDSPGASALTPSA